MNNSFDSEDSQISEQSIQKNYKMGKIEAFQHLIKQDLVGLPKFQFANQNNYWSNISTSLLCKHFHDSHSQGRLKSLKQVKNLKRNVHYSRIQRSRSLEWSSVIRQVAPLTIQFLASQSPKFKSSIRRGARFVNKNNNQFRNALERLKDMHSYISIRRKSCHCSECGPQNEKQFKSMRFITNVVIPPIKKAGDMALDSFNQLYQTVSKKDIKKLNTEPIQQTIEQQLQQINSEISSQNKIHRQSLSIKQSQGNYKQARISTISSQSQQMKSKKISINYKKFQCKNNQINQNDINKNNKFKPIKFGDQYKLNGYFKFQKNRTKTIQKLQSELNIIRSKNKSQQFEPNQSNNQIYQSIMFQRYDIQVKHSPYFANFQILKIMEEKRKEQQLISNCTQKHIKLSSQTAREQIDTVSSQMTNKMRKIFR